eukprot:scaffold143171_cov35-Attheya_sp.AAC.1
MAAVHTRIAAHPSLMAEVCSAPLDVALFLSNATRCAQTIVEAWKFPPVLVVGSATRHMPVADSACRLWRES